MFIARIQKYIDFNVLILYSATLLNYFVGLIFFDLFKTGFCYAIQAGLELIL